MTEQITGDCLLDCSAEPASRGTRESSGAAIEPDHPASLTIESLTVSIGEYDFTMQRGDTAEDFFRRIENTL